MWWSSFKEKMERTPLSPKAHKKDNYWDSFKVIFGINGVKYKWESHLSLTSWLCCDYTGKYLSPFYSENDKPLLWIQWSAKFPKIHLHVNPSRGLHKMSYPESSGVYLVTQSLRSLGPRSPLAHTRTKTLASKIDPQQYIDHCCLADRARSWVLRILCPRIKLTWIYREMSEMTQNKFWSFFALKAKPDSEPVHPWSGWCLGVSFLAMSGMMSRK